MADYIIDNFVSMFVTGGFIIQKECTDYIKRNGEMKPGDVYVSTAGTLPCTKVIHTVGPKWRGGELSDMIFSFIHMPHFGRFVAFSRYSYLFYSFNRKITQVLYIWKF